MPASLSHSIKCVSDTLPTLSHYLNVSVNQLIFTVWLAGGQLLRNETKGLASHSTVHVNAKQKNHLPVIKAPYPQAYSLSCGWVFTLWPQRWGEGGGRMVDI